MHYKTLLIPIFSGLIFTGCVTTSISKIDNKLILQNDKQFIHTYTDTIQKKFINLGSVFIDQEVLRLEEGDIITYESVRIQRPYRIKHSYNRALGLIFDSKSVTKFARSNALDYYRVTLRNNLLLHVVVKSSSKKQFAMVYGTNACLFENAFKLLSDKSHLNQCDTNTQKSHSYIYSNWQPKLIILDSLLEMEPGVAPR